MCSAASIDLASFLAGGIAVDREADLAHRSKRSPITGEESASLCRALQPVDEAFAPARIERLPVQLALGLRVRRAATLDHHRRQHLAGEELAQPEGHMTGRLRCDDVLADRLNALRSHASICRG